MTVGVPKHDWFLCFCFIFQYKFTTQLADSQLYNSTQYDIFETKQINLNCNKIIPWHISLLKKIFLLKNIINWQIDQNNKMQFLFFFKKNRCQEPNWKTSFPPSPSIGEMSFRTECSISHGRYFSPLPVYSSLEKSNRNRTFESIYNFHLKDKGDRGVFGALNLIFF